MLFYTLTGDPFCTDINDMNDMCETFVMETVAKCIRGQNWQSGLICFMTGISSIFHVQISSPKIIRCPVSLAKSRK